MMAKVKGRIEPLTFNYYVLAMGKGSIQPSTIGPSMHVLVYPCSIRTCTLHHR
jgi:hypothetical protein